MNTLIDACLKVITLLAMIAAIIVATIKTKSNKKVVRDKINKLTNSDKYRLYYVDKATGIEYELTRDNVKVKTIDD